MLTVMFFLDAWITRTSRLMGCGTGGVDTVCFVASAASIDPVLHRHAVFPPCSRCSWHTTRSDPDIQHLPFMAISPKFFASLYSVYHDRVMVYDFLGRCLVSVQHLLFYPLM